MDIVDILRSCHVITVDDVDVFTFDGDGGATDDIARSAADEITELRARVTELERDLALAYRRLALTSARQRLADG